MEFRGYQTTLRRDAAAGRRHRRSSSATTRSTGCWSRPAHPTRRTGSSPPTSCACSCSACCARSSRRIGPGPASPCTPRRRCSSRRRWSPPTPWTGITCPRCKVDAGDPMAAWLAALSVSEPKARLEALDGASGDHGRGPAGPDPHRAGRRALRRRGRHHRRRCSATTPGSGAPSGCPAWPRCPRTTRPLPGRPFNAVYGQVPGELAPKLALALACELSGEHDVAEALYLVCARTDANYTAPAAFGLARIRSGARRPGRRAGRAGPGPAHQPGLRRGAPAAGRAAGRGRPGPGQSGGGDAQHRRRRHRPDRPGQADHERPRRGPADRAHDRPAVRADDRRPPGHRAAAAGRAGGGLPRTSPGCHTIRTSGCAWSTPPTGSGAGRSGERRCCRRPSAPSATRRWPRTNCSARAAGRR